jgi:nicotinic acid mononucleotide adenylyltransferase
MQLLVMASMAATDARRVLLFGLSANPPTGAQGHMGILSHCCRLPARRGDGGAVAMVTAFDEVWLLPVFQHIYASKRRLAPFRDRLAMLQLAVDDVLGPNEGARLSTHPV